VNWVVVITRPERPEMRIPLCSEETANYIASLTVLPATAEVIPPVELP
jgi:hypothetical protein